MLKVLSIILTMLSFESKGEIMTSSEYLKLIDSTPIIQLPDDFRTPPKSSGLLAGVRSLFSSNQKETDKERMNRSLKDKKYLNDGKPFKHIDYFNSPMKGYPGESRFLVTIIHLQKSKLITIKGEELMDVKTGKADFKTNKLKELSEVYL